MIGTSDGQQFESSFEHTIASTMPPGASEKPVGALNTPTRYLPSQFPPAPDPNQFYKPPAGSILPHHEQLMQNQELSNTVKLALSHPSIQEAINNPKIDRTHDVPYEAGASAKPNDLTTHIDKSIPTSVSLDGQTFDPAIPANIHEQLERHVMENLIGKGMSNEKAYEIAHHEFAEPAEDAWYKANGISVDSANKWWAKQDKTTEKETSKDKDFPKDLYKKPYPHNEVEGVKHEPSGVSAEWATDVPLPQSDPRKDDLDLSTGTPRWKSDAPITHPPIVDGKYDKLPMSDNVDDRRSEVSNMARDSKSIDELLDKLAGMVHAESPEDAAKYYKEMIKPGDMSDPLARKAGIVDLLHQLRVLNKMDKRKDTDPDWVK